VDFVVGSAYDLPFASGSVDVAFSHALFEHLSSPADALAELRRVLRPGGRLGILEITTPRGPIKVFYKLWFDRIVPLLGRVLPGGAAYTYLPASVRRFPAPEALAELLASCGFRDVEFRRFAGGIVALHAGEAGS
jgi:demethylmenaquinone methyltransferase/2-methoxy-6-polyprenyl-1,4-benzoquinol methylase